jgi:cytoskeletal protein RodZ
MTHGGRSLGQMLREAREAKRWDIARAERETRIRARYLVALEQGDYRDLPSTVYTRGFVQNYARFLGLDPDLCLDLYRLEATPDAAPRPAITAPRPVALRRRGTLILTRGRVIAVTLVVLVVALGGYLGYQFVTFAGTPELTLTDPASDLAAYAGTSYLLRGDTVPDAQITVDGLRENPTATASPSGTFAIRVELVPGSNVITLVATDPITGRRSDPVRRTITVTLDAASPGPGGAPALTAPEADAVIIGPVTVSGIAAPGATLSVSTILVGAPIPSFDVTTIAGQPIAVPPWSPIAPEPATITADLTGAFTTLIDLGIGTWEVRVIEVAAAPTAAPSAEPPREVVRRLTVVAPSGLHGVLEIRDGPAYLEIEVDDVPMEGVSGTDQPAGTRITLAADEQIRMRTGDAGRIHLLLNGYPVSPLGEPGAVVEWHIRAVVPGD